VTPCLSPHDACTIYPVRVGRPSERWCCLARERYDAGEIDGERLERACEMLLAIEASDPTAILEGKKEPGRVGAPRARQTPSKRGSHAR